MIFADPRGGSTWITEIISSFRKTAILCEPLHLRAAPLFRELGFSWQQFIPEEAIWNEAKEAFEYVLRGRAVNSYFAGYHSSFYSFLTADKMIVKFCRASAMLPWLTRNFRFKYAPVYLVRHPFAVVASQLKHPSWDHEFSGYHIPKCRFNDFELRHAEFLLGLRSWEEAQVAKWCLHNLIPLGHTRNNKDWITVYYEDLLADPHAQISRIFDRWQLPMPDNILRKVGKPSATTLEATFKQGVEHHLAKWKCSFDQNQLKKMMAVLDYFEVEHYNGDILPKTMSNRDESKEPQINYSNSQGQKCIY